MGIFDCLIDKENLTPKVGVEYIYDLDTMWVSNKLGETKTVEEGRIVIDVIQKESGGYEFTDKESGKRYTCTYGWAFIEKTPEDLIRLKEISQKQEEINKLNSEILLLKSVSNTLYDFKSKYEEEI